MVEHFRVFNDSGIIIPIKLDEHYYDIYRNIDENVLQQFFKGRRNGLMWNHNNQEVVLQDKVVSIRGFPSTRLDFVVAVYMGLGGEYQPPQNAVIYNLDGSVHKVLTVPRLLSKHAITQLETIKKPNPPLQMSRTEDGLQFGGFGWLKDNNNELTNCISVVFNGQWWEQRILDVETGEIGAMMSSGRL